MVFVRRGALYLVFPLVIPWLRKLDVRGLQIALGAAVFVVILVPMLLHPNETVGVEYWASYTFPFTRFAEFLAGVTAALLVREGFRIRVPFQWAVVLAVVVSLVANWIPSYLTFAAATVIPFLLLIVSAAQRDLEGIGSFASSKWIVRLGEWSYAFYLVHLLVLRTIIAVNQRTLGLPWWVVGSIVLVIAIALSGLLCEYVEKKLERRFRGGRRVPDGLPA